MATKKTFETLKEAKKYQWVGFRKEYKKDASFKPIILKKLESEGYIILVPEKAML